MTFLLGRGRETVTEESEDINEERRDDVRGSQTGELGAYVVVVAGSFVYTALMFTWFSLPAYLPTIMEDVGLNGTQAGFLAGAVPLTYIPLALFSGLVVDRIGPGPSLAIALLLVGTGQLARSFATDFLTLLLSTLLLGVGATVVTFGLPKLVSVLYPADRTGFPSSIYLVGAAAGSGAAFGLGRPLLGPALGGWRPLFYWSGIVTLAYLAVWLWATRLASLGAPSTTGNRVDLSEIKGDLRIVLTHSQLRFVVVLGVTYLSILHGLQGWLPTILESRGLSPARAGQTTTLLVGANVAGILTIPGLADRFDRRRMAVIGSAGLAGLGVTLLILGGASSLAVVGILAAGVGVGGLSPMVRAIPPALDGIGVTLTATAVGLVFAVGEIGGFLGPVLIGGLHDLTGSYVPGLAILAASAIAAIAAGMGLNTLDSTAQRGDS